MAKFNPAFEYFDNGDLEVKSKVNPSASIRTKSASKQIYWLFLENCTYFNPSAGDEDYVTFARCDFEITLAEKLV